MTARLNNSRGMVFVAASLMMVILMSLGMGYLSMMRTELSITRNYWDSLKAFNDAESALAHSLAEILNNNDTDSDGLGTIPWKDLDGDSAMDYSAVYNSGTQLITATGRPGMGNAVRTVQVKLAPKKWTGAFMVGNRIPTVNNCDFSTVTGNVDARSTINVNFTTQHTITGTVTQNNAGLSIPTTDTTSGGPWVGYTPVANRHTDCTWVTPTITGVHYVSGNCIINFAGANPLTINGSLVVNGNLTISQVRGLTITPSGNDPALVASGTMSLSNISPTSVNISGLIYAGGNITLTSWDFWAGHTINGAIVTEAGDIALNTVARTDWIFDSSMDPPFFSGGGSGGVVVEYWKGHQ